MKINLPDLLPDELSDESAYHLVTFFINITTELESHYFDQLRRYMNVHAPSNFIESIDNVPDNENPF